MPRSRDDRLKNALMRSPARAFLLADLLNVLSALSGIESRSQLLADRAEREVCLTILAEFSETLEQDKALAVFRSELDQLRFAIERLVAPEEIGELANQVLEAIGFDRGTIA